jgi:tetratricopeptide (TPR) repeat protein
MDKKIRYIESLPLTKGWDDDLNFNNEDSELFETIGDYMKGRSDLNDVMNDPDYLKTKKIVRSMISVNNGSSLNKENDLFIRNSFERGDLKKEISGIRLEIDQKKINEITADWVKEWHERKQKLGMNDPKMDERRSFIFEAMQDSERLDQDTGIRAQGMKENVETLLTVSSNAEKSSERNKTLRRSLIIRYSSFAAAAVLGAFMIIKTLSPSQPEGLFTSYYKPYELKSVVTRGSENTSNTFSKAIEDYKSGNYQTAALGFNQALQADPLSVSKKFYLGLSELAIQNYDEAANLLSSVVSNSAEFSKEARWYLGLAYLEKGNDAKAAECFKYLAENKGYYSERAEKILRRLK